MAAWGATRHLHLGECRFSVDRGELQQAHGASLLMRLLGSTDTRQVERKSSEFLNNFATGR